MMERVNFEGKRPHGEYSMITKAVDSDELATIIYSQLDSIDSLLIEQDIDVSDRPSIAADIFVKTCIIRVNDDRPDYYPVQPWFKDIIGPIRKWYRTKYGNTTIHRREKVAKGVILQNGVFYEVEIPLRLIIPKGELRHLIFPKEIQPFEDSGSFVKDPPKFSPNTHEAICFDSSVRKVVNLTRSINNNLTTAEFENHLCDELAHGIEPNIQKAVDDILSGQKNRYLNSFWEIHLALEKSMKVIIAQTNQSFKLTHDLLELVDVVNKIKPGLIKPEAIKQFPAHRKVISYRYGQGPSLGKADIHSNYVHGLVMIDILTYQFERKYVFNNTTFILQKLPWQ